MLLGGLQSAIFLVENLLLRPITAMFSYGAEPTYNFSFLLRTEHSSGCYYNTAEMPESEVVSLTSLKWEAFRAETFSYVICKYTHHIEFDLFRWLSLLMVVQDPIFGTHHQLFYSGPLHLTWSILNRRHLFSCLSPLPSELLLFQSFLNVTGC